MTMTEVSSASKPLIFLIEDDPNETELFSIAMEQSGVEHELVVARDGQDGLQKINEALENGRVPDLVLTDLKMPRMNGVELLRSLRANEVSKHLPIVLFSSSNEREDIDLAYVSRANAYVQKPAKFQEYQETVKNIAQFWGHRNSKVS